MSLGKLRQRCKPRRGVPACRPTTLPPSSRGLCCPAGLRCPALPQHDGFFPRELTLPRWPRPPRSSPGATGQGQLPALGAPAPSSPTPGSGKKLSQGCDSHWTRCRDAQESFPAPALRQRGSEEAEQQALCDTEFPTEAMLVLAPRALWHARTPPSNHQQGQKPPWILGSCRFDANKQLSAHKSRCQRTRAWRARRRARLRPAPLSPRTPFAFLPLTLLLRAGARR